MFIRTPQTFSRRLLQFTLGKRFKTDASFRELDFFNSGGKGNKFQFDYDVYKPNHTFLSKSINNPNESIVFLHDILSSKHAMEVEANDICQTLETDVYTLNFRNYSNKLDTSSSKHEFRKFYKFNEELLVKDVTNFCKEMGLKKVILIGEGYGGKIAMLTSLESKLKISKLVSIEGLPRDLPEKAVNELSNWIDALLNIINESHIAKTDKLYLEKCYKIMSSNRFGIHDFKTIQYLLNNISKKPINQGILDGYPYLEPMIPLTYIKEHIIPEYAKWKPINTQFTNPSLFLMGRSSNYFNSSQDNNSSDVQQCLDKYFPDNKLKTFNSNHFVLDNQSTHVSNAICQFLLYDYNPQYDELRKEDGLIS